MGGMLAARTKKRCTPDRLSLPQMYMRQRWYDSSLQRFISRDPIGLSAGTNSYVYVRNNPLAFIDPAGLQPTFPGLDAPAGSTIQIPHAIDGFFDVDPLIVPPSDEYPVPGTLIRRIHIVGYCRCDRGWTLDTYSLGRNADNYNDILNSREPEALGNLYISNYPAMSGQSFSRNGITIYDPKLSPKPGRRPVTPAESASIPIRGKCMCKRKKCDDTWERKPGKFELVSAWGMDIYYNGVEPPWG